jgi:(E)-4-hydroxy-3-methylbut-2-enyl-diphosphate synthase
MPRKTRVIKIGGYDGVNSVYIGGEYPVAIQTMWKDRLSFSDLEGEAGEALCARIRRLGDMGCALLRFAVPDLQAAEIVGNLAERVAMPLSADIHFDYRIALRCMDFPIAKIRINPGNIGSRDRVEKVLSKASAKGIPIRIGVNGGSLPADLRQPVEKGTLDKAEALVTAAERELAVFRDFGFENVVVSMKASSAAVTGQANRSFAGRNDAPLHIGVTEAGPLIAGVVRNTAALYTLLRERIGATIRVSLSDTMENEVIACREILGAVADSTDREAQGVTIISCPRCGRNDFDTHGFTERWKDRLYSLKKNVVIAVMGCAVNGPEEAKHADLGISGAGGKVLIFRRGQIVRTLSPAEADEAFAEELQGL